MQDNTFNPNELRSTADPRPHPDPEVQASLDRFDAMYDRIVELVNRDEWPTLWALIDEELERSKNPATLNRGNLRTFQVTLKPVRMLEEIESRYKQIAQVLRDTNNGIG